MALDPDAFERWAVEHRDPDTRVPGYEHALYLRWAAEELLRQQREAARPLVAYTDGSGTMAHLPCGAGVVVYDGDAVVTEASRHLGLGTNNHAEISGVRIALAITDPSRPLVVRTDSMCAIGALTKPTDTAPNRPNARLINLTRRAMEGRTVTFEHVRGHAGIAGNVRADRLANLGRTRHGIIVPATRAA